MDNQKSDQEIARQKAGGVGAQFYSQSRVARGRLQKQRAAQKAALATAESAAGDESHKINKATEYLMYGSAIFSDFIIFLIGLIPVAGQLIAPIIGFVVMGFFMFWFLMKGVRPLTPRRLKLMGVGALISLVPFVPPTTFYVWRMIKSTKGRSVLGKASGKLAGGMLK